MSVWAGLWYLWRFEDASHQGVDLDGVAAVGAVDEQHRNHVGAKRGAQWGEVRNLTEPGVWCAVRVLLDVRDSIRRRNLAATVYADKSLVYFRWLGANICVHRPIDKPPKWSSEASEPLISGVFDEHGRGFGFAVRSLAIGKRGGVGFGFVVRDSWGVAAPDFFSRSIVVPVIAFAFSFCFPPVYAPESCP